MKKLAALCGVVALSFGLVACNSNRDIVAEAGEAIEEEGLPGNIRVSNNNGIVTLTGTVPDASVKERAGEIVGEVDDVHQVINDLRTTAGDAPLDMHDSTGRLDDGTKADTYYPPAVD